VRWLERFDDQRFSLADAVSFEVMRREKVKQAFAFDQRFEIAGFALVRQDRGSPLTCAPD
jgi:predicted nucleic acid-binding protein